jgi:hypothetical protein
MKASLFTTILAIHFASAQGEASAAESATSDAFRGPTLAHKLFGRFVAVLIENGMHPDLAERFLGRPTASCRMTSGGLAIEWRSFPAFGVSVFLAGEDDCLKVTRVSVEPIFRPANPRRLVDLNELTN